jgi:hypothetical protein
VRRMVGPVLFGAALVAAFPSHATMPALPPPYMSVPVLQFMCNEKSPNVGDRLRYAAECHGYVRAIVDRYFETDYRMKRRQIFPTCDWNKTTDLMIAEIRESENGSISYSDLSRAEPWLRAKLKQKCDEER